MKKKLILKTVRTIYKIFNTKWILSLNENENGNTIMFLEQGQHIIMAFGIAWIS